MASSELYSLVDLYKSGRFAKLFEIVLDDSQSSQLFENDDYHHSVYKLKMFKLRQLYQEGLDLIQKLKDNNNLEQNQIDLLNYFRANYYLNQGLHQKSLKIIDALSTRSGNINSTDYPIIGNFNIVLAILKSHYYNQLGEMSLASYYANQAYHLSKDNPDDINLVEIYNNLVLLLIEQGEIEIAKERIEELLLLSDEKENSYFKFSALLLKSRIYTELTELDKGLQILDMAYELAGKFEAFLPYYYLNHMKGAIYRLKGDLQKGREIYMDSLHLHDHIGSDMMKSAIYNNLGILENTAGNLDLALDYLFRSLEILETKQNLTKKGTAYNNIAINYLMKGDLDLSLEYLEKSKEIAEQNGTQKSKATAYVNLGQTYHRKGEFEQAEKYYLQCYEIDKQHENDFNVSEVLYNLIVLHVETGNIEKAKHFLKILHEVSVKNSNETITLRYRLGQVHVLKSSKRSINQAKAQEILKEIVDGEPGVYEYYVDALLNLCEVLLIELKQTGEEEILTEIKEYVQILADYATRQNSHGLLAEAYLIKSKLAELELDMVKAREFLELAEREAIDKGQDKLTMKISLYFDQLLDKLKSVDSIAQKNISLKERLEDVQLEEVLLQMIDTKTEEVKSDNEIPKMFHIIQEGGNSIYSRNFQSDNEFPEDLVAGLFSALHSLSDQVFNTSSGTQRIRHEQYTIIMKPVDQTMLFSYVFMGSSYNAMKKLDRIVDSIKSSSTIWDALNRDISHLTSQEKEGMNIIVDSIFNI